MRRLLPFIVAIALIAAPPANAQSITVTSTDVPKFIPDNDPIGISSVLTGPALTNLTDLNLVFNSLQHTSVADLHVELRSPSGTTVPLILSFTENGILTGLGTPVNFTSTVFDDQAPTNLTAGTAPYTGSFNINHPSVVANPLSVFNGEDATGQWTLFVSDRAPADVGTLDSWSLEFTGVAVPEPTTVALCGLVLGGGAFTYWRRRSINQKALASRFKKARA